MQLRAHTTSAMFGLVLAAAMLPTSGVQVEAPKPNFILILADDLGWTDLGCMGSRFYETPHLNRLDVVEGYLRKGGLGSGDFVRGGVGRLLASKGGTPASAIAHGHSEGPPFPSQWKSKNFHDLPADLAAARWRNAPTRGVQPGLAHKDDLVAANCCLPIQPVTLAEQDLKTLGRSGEPPLRGAEQNVHLCDVRIRTELIGRKDYGGMFPFREGE